ncbi:hypothetical protein GE061_005988 [Apolygus lucorum]|uniref:Uncharacterized protein n=1 Tax=Apolygus lucorum TaxID=248454 RepID=A0A8S9WRX7_APOLU|nr:hypothetical protein GE061_005988 [Apolygus lucorum]
MPQFGGTLAAISNGILSYLKITHGGAILPAALAVTRTVMHSFSSGFTIRYTVLSPLRVNTARSWGSFGLGGADRRFCACAGGGGCDGGATGVGWRKLGPGNPGDAGGAAGGELADLARARLNDARSTERGAEFHQDQQQDTEVWDEARMKQAEDTIKSYIPKNYKPPNGKSQPPASVISGTPYVEDLRFAFRPPEEFDGRTIPGIPYSDEERDAGFTVYQVAHFYDEVRAGRIDALPGENYLQWSRRKNREDTEVWDEARMKRAEDTIKSYIPKNYKPPNGNSQPPASMISGTPYDEDLRFAFRPPEEFDGRTIPGIPYSDEERDAGFTVYQVAHFYDEDTEVWDEARMKRAEDTIRSYIPKNYKPPNGNSQSCPSEPPPSRPKTMRSPPPGRAGAEPVGWSPADRSADGRSLAGPSPAGRSADGRSLAGPSPAGRSADGRSPAGRSPAGRSADGRPPAGRSPAPASTSRGTASSNYQNPNRKFFGLSDESRASPKPRSPVATSPRPGTSAARTKPPVGFGSSSSRTGPRGTGVSNCSSVDQRTHSKLW